MTPKTVYAFLVLLFGSWAIELFLGGGMLRWYWGTAWFARNESSQQSMADVIVGFGSIIRLVNGQFQTTSLHWTVGGVLLVLMCVYVGLHVVYALWAGLMRPWTQRWRLGARPPSRREREQFEAAFAALARHASRRVSRPGRWRVTDGLGLQMRWVGSVLVIDRQLLGHRHFPPLLAHQLGHVNSEDRLAHRLYDLLPPTSASIGALGGFPLALGHMLLFPFWMWYWRERMFAADAFAVQLGQGHALIRALDEVYLPLDQTTMGGRVLKPVPYVEQRIDRVQRLMARVMPPGGATRLV